MTIASWIHRALFGTGSYKLTLRTYGLDVGGACDVGHEIVVGRGNARIRLNTSTFFL